MDWMQQTVDWVDEPSTTVWVLTVIAGLLWILIRRWCIPSRMRSHAPISTTSGADGGWWHRLRQCLPHWPQRPNVLLLVISPSPSRSLAQHTEEEEAASTPPSNETVSVHFESNSSHRRRRRQGPHVDAPEALTSDVLASVRFVPVKPHVL